MADNDPQNARELFQFAENLLQHVHENFQTLADKLVLRHMGERIDDLEKHVNGLVAQAGVENASEEWYRRRFTAGQERGDVYTEDLSEQELQV